MNTHAFTENDREAVLKVLADETALKVAGKPYREAVILSCEICLRANPRQPLPAPEHDQVKIVRPSQPPSDMWWNRD